MTQLLATADRLGITKMVWMPLRGGGWKCTVSGPYVPPCQGRGATGAEALADLVGFLTRTA